MTFFSLLFEFTFFSLTVEALISQLDFVSIDTEQAEVSL